jgi:hypothetical protein
MWVPLSVRLGLMPASARVGRIVFSDVFYFCYKILISSGVTIKMLLNSSTFFNKKDALYELQPSLGFI